MLLWVTVGGASDSSITIRAETSIMGNILIYIRIMNTLLYYSDYKSVEIDAV